MHLRKNIKHFKDVWDGKPFEIKDASMKIDGFGCEFGYKDGVFYFRSSRSDMIYDGMQFVEYGLNHFPTDMNRMYRAYCYKDVFNILRATIPEEENSFYRCELQYTPMSTSNGELITFVNVPYHRSALGALLSIWVLDSSHELKINHSGVMVQSPLLPRQKFESIEHVLTAYWGWLSLYSPIPEGIVFTYKGECVKIINEEFKQKMKELKNDYKTRSGRTI